MVRGYLSRNEQVGVDDDYDDSTTRLKEACWKNGMRRRGEKGEMGTRGRAAARRFLFNGVQGRAPGRLVRLRSAGPEGQKKSRPGTCIRRLQLAAQETRGRDNMAGYLPLAPIVC